MRAAVDLQPVFRLRILDGCAFIVEDHRRPVRRVIRLPVRQARIVRVARPHESEPGVHHRIHQRHLLRPGTNEFLSDLADAVAETLGTATDNCDTAYATVD